MRHECKFCSIIAFVKIKLWTFHGLSVMNSDIWMSGVSLRTNKRLAIYISLLRKFHAYILFLAIATVYQV